MFLRMELEEHLQHEDGWTLITLEGPVLVYQATVRGDGVVVDRRKVNAGLSSGVVQGVVGCCGVP